MNTNETDIANAIHLEVKQYLLKDLTEAEALERFETLLFSLSSQSGLSENTIIDVALSHSVDNATIEDIDAVVDFLRFYRITRSSKRRSGIKEQIRVASQGKLALDSRLMNEVGLMQNRHRGKLFEMMGKILVRSYFERQGRKGVEIVSDRVTFLSADASGRKARRRFDLYLPETKVGIEIKSGRVRFNRFTRDQIYKDSHLIRQGIVTEIWWFLFYGASKRVLEELDRHGISHADQALTDYE